ncbi:glycosyl hydrolase family 61-domain-containing protein, partial [Schizothecium vesticola]
ALAALATSISAHATIYGVSVNGISQGPGFNLYIRSPPSNSPIKDLSSPSLACNVNGGTPAPSFVRVAAGDTLTLEWQHDRQGDDIIDPSHQGPIITYIAPLTASTGDGSGPIWTKIAEDGFAGGRWAVDRLIANRGKNDVVLPRALAAGRYLVRQEIIAHHESDVAFKDNKDRGAQFYPGCLQFDVSGEGTAVPDQGFDFNVGYTYADPGIVFNKYAPFSSYKIPGPAVWTGAGTGGGGAPAPVPVVSAPANPGNPAATTTTKTAAGVGASPTPTAGPVSPPVQPP